RVEQVALHVDGRRELAGGTREAGELVHRLALHAQRDDEARDLDWRGVPAHDRLEGRGGLSLGQGFTPHQLRNRLDHAAALAARRMKLARIFLPSFVSIDSGWNCTP